MTLTYKIKLDPNTKQVIYFVLVKTAGDAHIETGEVSK